MQKIRRIEGSAAMTELESKCYSCEGVKCPTHETCRQWLEETKHRREYNREMSDIAFEEATKQLRKDLQVFRESMKQEVIKA